MCGVLRTQVWPSAEVGSQRPSDFGNPSANDSEVLRQLKPGSRILQLVIYADENAPSAETQNCAIPD
jgi:hypothetical protein